MALLALQQAIAVQERYGHEAGASAAVWRVNRQLVMNACPSLPYRNRISMPLPPSGFVQS